MLIKSDDRYIPSLIRLWNVVFGDSEEYIKLFFKEAFYDCYCFAEIDGNEVVSAFYLLKCSIKLNGYIYNGRYLYAAATLPEYRGKGLMGKLIKAAVTYAESENLDFIALVPADDGLYDYYSRFGFKESMYKYIVSLKGSICSEGALIKSADDFSKIRNTSSCDMLVYNKIGLKYAFECMQFWGTDIVRLGDNTYYAADEELFVGDCSNPESVLDKISGDEVYTNYPFDGAVKIKNGMIYNFRNDIEFKDIYMNIALD